MSRTEHWTREGATAVIEVEEEGGHERVQVSHPAAGRHAAGVGLRARGSDAASGRVAPMTDRVLLTVHCHLCGTSDTAWSTKRQYGHQCMSNGDGHWRSCGWDIR